MSRKPKVADLGAQPCSACGERLRHLEGCPLIAHDTVAEAVAGTIEAAVRKIVPDATPEQVAALSGYVDGVAEEAYESGAETAREPLLAALEFLLIRFEQVVPRAARIGNDFDAIQKARSAIAEASEA